MRADDGPPNDFGWPITRQTGLSRRPVGVEGRRRGSVWRSIWRQISAISGRATNILRFSMT